MPRGQQNKRTLLISATHNFVSGIIVNKKTMERYQLPSYLYLGKLRCAVSYNGQIQTCSYCTEQGHKFKECPKRIQVDNNSACERDIPMTTAQNEESDVERTTPSPTPPPVIITKRFLPMQKQMSHDEEQKEQAPGARGKAEQKRGCHWRRIRSSTRTNDPRNGRRMRAEATRERTSAGTRTEIKKIQKNNEVSMITLHMTFLLCQ